MSKILKYVDNMSDVEYAKAKEGATKVKVANEVHEQLEMVSCSVGILAAYDFTLTDMLKRAMGLILPSEKGNCVSFNFGSLNLLILKDPSVGELSSRAVEQTLIGNNLGYAPKVYAYNDKFILSEKVAMIPLSKVTEEPADLSKKLENTIIELYDAKVIPLNLDQSNVFYNKKTGKFIFTDFSDWTTADSVNEGSFWTEVSQFVAATSESLFGVLQK